MDIRKFKFTPPGMIKHRGREKGTGRWVIGQWDGEGCIFAQDRPDVFRFFAVEPATISAETGWHDKHGTDMYGGDIYRWSIWDPNEEDYVSDIGVIFWSEEQRRYNVYFPEEDCLLDGEGFWLDEPNTEIIGNVWENKELIGGKYGNT